MFNKKGDFSGKWVEYLFIILIMVGFLLSMTLENQIITYLISYLAGIQCGFLTYRNIKNNRTFPIWIIIIGFLVGYLIGSYQANKLTIIILFILGIINGHMFFKKNKLLFSKLKK